MKKPNRVFNWRHKEDSRDRIAKPRRRAEKLTRRLWPMRWRPFDQGSDPYCVGYAWAGWMRWATQWPHMQALAPWILRRCQAARSMARRGLRRFECARWGEIAQGTEVARTLRIFDQTRHAYRSSFVRRPGRDGYQLVSRYVVSDDDRRVCIGHLLPADSTAGHAYLLRGVNIKDEYVIIRNSWGDGLPAQCASVVCLPRRTISRRRRSVHPYAVGESHEIVRNRVVGGCDCSRSSLARPASPAALVV